MGVAWVKEDQEATLSYISGKFIFSWLRPVTAFETKLYSAFAPVKNNNGKPH